jgi:DUF4097 and DUF4098 domain-containing protein YvlB
MTRLLTLSFACVTMLLGQDMASVKEDFKYSYALSPNGRVSLETFNGSIEVVSWDRNEVEVVGTKYAASDEALREIRVETANTPDSVSVRAYRPKSEDRWWRTGNHGVRMVVRVPKKVQLERVSTSNGEVRVSEIDGNARVSTSNGAIRIVNLTGRLDASTSNGRIEASGLGAEATLRTSNGAIDMTFASFRGQPIEASTSNGAITLRLAGGVNADLRATTSNGRVSSDYDVTTRGSLEKNRLEGRIGEGGALIRLSSSNGAIRIAKI